MSNRTVTITGTLASDVAAAATVTVSYPARSYPQYGVYSAASFVRSFGHKLTMGQADLTYPVGFDITLGGGTTFTFTNKTAATWPAGTKWTLMLDKGGKDVFLTSGRTVNRMKRSDTFIIDLGDPDVADSDGISASQTVTGAGTAFLINGALASGGAVVLESPRNVVAAWTNTAIITITGYDEYGALMHEVSASGTSHTGVKAFAKVTGVTTNATVTGATVGTGDVLGLPVFLPSIGHIIYQLEDGATVTAGTVVAGMTTAGGSTTSTPDVRGTYDPNSATNGAKTFQLVVALPDPTNIGAAQA